MSNELKYVGTKWQKCDFHLHTIQSKCFSEKSVTPTQWVEEAIKKGLDCIAITDHNDYRGIDSIIEAAYDTDLTVFPGVEVTCDTSKIHLLIIFDPSKTSETVRDFLSKLDIDSENIDTTDGTSKSVFEVCKLAKEKGALVIAAHIDEYNGLSKVSDANINRIIENHYFDAVQVVNSNIWQECSKNSEEEKQMLAKRYGKEIPDSEAVEWRKCFNKFVNSSITLLCFSDNPSSQGDSKHGLWGIGTQYTWLKMDDKPTLESVRQALLSSELRVKTKYESKESPETLPNFWIKQMTFSKTSINPKKDVTVNFNPHLNTIIGGRGSGKSTIIRLLTGALSPDSVESTAVADDQKNFYKKTVRKHDGIFNENSSITINLVRSGTEYKIDITNIIDSRNQTIDVFKIQDGHEIPVDGTGILSLFKPRVFTQKQIYETAKNESALMELIDSKIDSIPRLIKQKEELINALKNTLVDIQSYEEEISNENDLKFKLEDTDKRIELFNSSGISDLISKYNKKKIAIDNIIKIKDKHNEIVDFLKNSIFVPEIDKETISQNLASDEILNLLDDYALKSKKQLSVIQSSVEEYQKIANEMYEKFICSAWYKDFLKEQLDIETNKQQLSDEGIDYSALDELMNKSKDLKNQLDEIKEKKIQLTEKKTNFNNGIKKLKDIINEISDERKKYASALNISSDNVKIVVNPMMSEESFISFIKTTLNKDSQSIIDDIENYCKTLFPDNTSKSTPLQRIDDFRTLIKSMREGNIEKSFSGFFRRTVLQLDKDNYYKLLLFYPDDKIELQYKPEGAKSKFSPLSSASAGQKAAAILTVILSQGEEPILLDQPEDDLDNKLVYELVVQRIKKFKEQKQIIVVTHNANIPVNGDAEYITSMDSQTLKVQIKCEGTLDESDIRKEICDVMEGTEYAFEMRAKKYHLKVKK